MPGEFHLHRPHRHRSWTDVTDEKEEEENVKNPEIGKLEIGKFYDTDFHEVIPTVEQTDAKKFVVGAVKGLAGGCEGVPYRIELDLQQFCEKSTHAIKKIAGHLKDFVTARKKKKMKAALADAITVLHDALVEFVTKHSGELYGLRAATLVLIYSIWNSYCLITSILLALSGDVTKAIQLAIKSISKTTKTIRNQDLIRETFGRVKDWVKHGEWDFFGYFLGQQINLRDDCDFNDYKNGLQQYNADMNSPTRGDVNHRKYFFYWIEIIIKNVCSTALALTNLTLIVPVEVIEIVVDIVVGFICSQIRPKIPPKTHQDKMQVVKEYHSHNIAKIGGAAQQSTSKS